MTTFQSRPFQTANKRTRPNVWNENLSPKAFNIFKHKGRKLNLTASNTLTHIKMQFYFAYSYSTVPCSQVWPLQIVQLFDKIQEVFSLHLAVFSKMSHMAGCIDFSTGCHDSSIVIAENAPLFILTTNQGTWALFGMLCIRVSEGGQYFFFIAIRPAQVCHFWSYL